MPEVTVCPNDHGGVAFGVSWAQPMRIEFGSRHAAERFAIWLRAEGGAVETDGSCSACAAHHASDHDCPSCGADLGLRVRPGGALARPAPSRRPPALEVAAEQHRIRVEQATAARDKRYAEYRQLAEFDRLLSPETVVA